MQKEEKNTSRASINFNNKWQSFLEKEIGPTGKGKTVQELRLPTKENAESLTLT